MISPLEFRRYQYFAGASNEVHNALAKISSIRQYKAGERLFEEGDSAKHLIIVKSGQVDIIYLLKDNHEVVAESAISGDVISWSAILAPYTLTASAVGFKDGELIEIDGKQLREMCDKDTSLGYQLLVEIARGLRDRLTGLRVQITAAKSM